MAYGPLPDEVMIYLARGIFRVTQSLEDGNLPLAMIKAVHLRFPEIEPANLAKMAACDMAKSNPWHDLLGMFTDAAHAVANSIVGTANAGEAPKRSPQNKPKRPARLSH
jgi:hypothetical protein